MKIAVITCYHDPDYVRARSLRAALKLVPGVKLLVIKNKHRGILRYPEVIWKIWQARRKQKPDAYLLTFRGQEILPFVLLLAGKKPVFFDEFIVPIAYATNEKHKRSFATFVKHSLARSAQPLYKLWLKKCRIILADTQAHAELSAKANKQNLRKYLVVPVSTDEKLFKPSETADKTTPFQVFYYSTGMQPLHGIPTVLEAAEQLRDNEDVEFLVVGGKKPMKKLVKAAQKRGARITYRSWIPFDELPATMRGAGINLGGPFGNTRQAHHVITTKTYQILACQTPVIVGAGEATSEYFIDKDNALVVPQANAEALVKAILWASKHPAELAAIAANGRKTYEKQFSVSAIARSLQRLAYEAA